MPPPSISWSSSKLLGSRDSRSSRNDLAVPSAQAGYPSASWQTTAASWGGGIVSLANFLCMQLYRSLVLAIVLLASPALGEGFICVAEQASGFVLAPGRSKAVSLKTEEKFLIRPRSGKKTEAILGCGSEAPKVPRWCSSDWLFFDFGVAPGSAMGVCGGGPDSNGIVSCSVYKGIKKVRMSTKTLRFTSAYLVVQGDDGWDGDTSSISHGTCEKL